jgi:hypothetical protein
VRPGLAHDSNDQGKALRSVVREKLEADELLVGLQAHAMLASLLAALPGPSCAIPWTCSPTNASPVLTYECKYICHRQRMRRRRARPGRHSRKAAARQVRPGLARLSLSRLGRPTAVVTCLATLSPVEIRCDVAPWSQPERARPVRPPNI